tara:strand:- start:1280 stop:2053 length:774 start_codon:yes stop_codon:yes gene_type:complete
MANTKLKEVQDQLPATTSTFEEDSSEYQENLTADDQSIPFLKIAAKADEEIGAKEGDAFNSVTGVVYSKETDIKIVPVYFEPAWIEWAPRGQGSGGPVNIFKSEKDAPKTERNEDYKDMIVGGNGNYIEYTHQHYCLIIDTDSMTTTSALVSMKSTQLKKSKKLNTMVLSQVLQGSKGPFNPPRFAYIYNFKTIQESNNKGDWHGWSISLDRMLNMDDDTEMGIYATAKMFRNAIAAGDVEVKHEQDGESGEDHDIF